jgi:hypothetical protein
MSARLHRSTIRRKAPRSATGLSQHPSGEEATRHIPDQVIKQFIERMREYASHHDLGSPTLLFAQSDTHYGVALDWRDYRRAFSFSKRGWTLADYQKLCNALRNW